MCQSWERIISFALWVTHRIELRAFIVKCPKVCTTCGPYTGKQLCPLPQKDKLVNYQMIGYESHLHSGSLEGCSVIITSHLM